MSQINNLTISQTKVNTLNPEVFEQIDRCGTRVRWLNHLGGECHWVFETIKYNIENKNIALIEKLENLQEIKSVYKNVGNKVNQKITLTTQCPSQFYLYLESILRTGKVEMFLEDKNVWVQIYNLKNNFEYEPNEAKRDFIFEFAMDKIYNVTL